MEQIGRYQLVRRLAVGGMAEVFLARAEGPKGFEKQLVIKRILAHLAEQPKFVQLFLSEARIAARLSHPNIASVFDLGEADGVPYLAMEYVDGPSLRGLLQRAQTLGRGLPVVLCARMASLAADGLAYAHEFCDPESGEWLGLIHRDVSPENVLVSMNGSVKVVDFGIAKAAGLEPSKSASLRGKYSYMAPEQLRGKQRLDRRVDVFALGVTLYELLTGKKPFEARGELEMMRAILFSEHMPASRRRPEIPEALDAILARALGKDRDARYPTCREFQADLEEFIRGTGEDVSAYRIARLVQSLDAIPRTPTGSHFPAQLPGVINTRTSPTRMAELAALGTRIGAQPAPVPEAQTPSSAGATRHLAASAAMLTPETRILPLDAVSPIDLTGTRTEVGPAARTWAPLLVGAALLTAGGGLMAYRFVDGVRESRRQTRLERAEARAVVHEEPTSLPMIERVVLPAQVTLRTSVPSELWIDGKKAGASPLRLEQVNPGPMTIEARGAHGAFRKTLTLAVMPGENGTREIEIARLPVDFHIPAGSRVWLDGLELGKTPLPPVHVYEGPHQIRVVLERLGRTLDTTIVVSPERANVFTFDLETTPD